MKRQYLAAGAAAVGLTLALAACGGGGNNNSGGPASATSNADTAKLAANNVQPVDKLDQGGTFTFAVGDFGPNFNFATNSGFSDGVSQVLQPIDNTGCFKSELDGTPVLNKDYCTDVKEDVKDGQQTITYTINPKAVWNDGTPIDVKTFESQWKALNGTNKDFDVPSTLGYDQIDSVTAGKDDREVVVKMKSIYEPYTDLFSLGNSTMGFVHPQADADPQVFNNGFVNDLKPQWRMGPFKLDSFDNTTKTAIYVPNDKWWGQKPVLSKIIVRAMESNATIPAFKNGEIDATDARTLGRYKQVENVAGTEIRRGQRTSVFGFIFNTTKGPLTDVNVRKAMFMAADREKMANVIFNGLNWTEKVPGSWALMPFDPNYSDNTAFKFDIDGAKKVLDDAGWKAGADGIREKDGQKLSTSVSYYGDDTTIAAFTQSFQAQMKVIGADVAIDAQPASAFADYLGQKKFNISRSGNGVGSDSTGSLAQYFDSKNSGNATGAGTPEIDAMIKKVPAIADKKERMAAVNNVEKEFSTLYAMLPVYNGPNIYAVKKGVANWGPALFGLLDWTQVGWEKGSTHK